jgi:hypothetical protein
MDQTGALEPIDVVEFWISLGNQLIECRPIFREFSVAVRRSKIRSEDSHRRLPP